MSEYRAWLGKIRDIITVHAYTYALVSKTPRANPTHFYRF
jgi:hypothetical protein